MIGPQFPAASGLSIPSTWRIAPLKCIIVSNDGGVWGDEATGEHDTFVLRSTEQTVDGKWVIDGAMPRHLTAKERAKALLSQGDLLVTKSSGSDFHIGKTTIVDSEIASHRYCYSNFMQRLRVNASTSPKYVYWMLNSSFARSQMAFLSNSTSGLGNLNGEILSNMFVTVPPRHVQSAIADFLDRETPQADELVAKYERLIDLLEDKRVSLVTQAVTKGLDSNVSLKDSGVEWIGAIPKHWHLSRMRFLCNVKTGNQDTANSIEGGDFPFFVRSQTVERIDSFEYDCEAVLTAGDGAGVGKVFHHIIGKFNAHQRVYILTNFKRVIGRFLYFYLMANFYKVALEGAAKSTVDSLRMPVFLNFPVTIPEHAEQDRIVSFLDAKLGELDDLSNKAVTAIALVREHRSALITAAVTGQIDVSTYQRRATQGFF